MKNPIMTASGTFGYGSEYEEFLDLRKLGAIVTKTVTYEPRSGNPPPRVIETPSGMLNSIGLENGGAHAFVKEKLPYLKKLNIPVIVSIGGESIEEFVRTARYLDGIDKIAALEINISCPNLTKRTTNDRRTTELFSQDAQLTYRAVKKIRRATALTVITKLSPNVTDIAEIAQAAEEAGSDAISLVNTYMGMAVDASARRPILGNVTGGLSGPAIKPLALKAVWDVYNSVDIPVIGMGGITGLADVLEFMICGASAVALGSINFVYPKICADIAAGLGRYLKAKKLKLNELIGSLDIS